jgi:hypothetical protein
MRYEKRWIGLCLVVALSTSWTSCGESEAPSEPRCGDGTCDGTESATTCPIDCAPVCGDDHCEGGETALTCYADCNDPAACGNEVCDPGETFAFCESDCAPGCGDGACELTESVSVCPVDCTRCGDAFCDPGENELNCPIDCGNAVCASPGTRSVTISLDHLIFPSGEEAPPVGADLDRHYTAEGDPEGCGRQDLLGGVDNALAGVLHSVKGALAYLGIDLQARMDELITSGSFSLSVKLDGFDGPNDDEILATVFVNDVALAEATQICTRSDAGGIVRLRFDRLTLPLSYGAPTDKLELHMEDVFLSFAVSSSLVVSNGLLAGTVVYEAEGEIGLRDEILELLTHFGQAGYIGTVDYVAEPELDMRDACDSHSMAFVAEFTGEE